MRRDHCASAILIFLASVAIGCGDRPGTGGDGGSGADANGGTLDGLASIRVEPADQTLVIDGDNPATSAYQAIGVFDDGSERDITDHVGFALKDPALGAFAGPTFTSGTSRGGRTTVTATYASVQGAASLTLTLRKRWGDPASADLPADPGQPFDGPADAGRDPQLIYPNDQVLLPPNLGKLEIHFYPGAGNGLFEVSFANQVTDIKVYLRCTQPLAGGCIYLPDPQLWSWLAESNRGGAPIDITVRGTDDDGTGVGQSNALEISFSLDDIRGAIYYWTTSQGTGIMRYDFGSPTQTEAEKFVGTELSDGTCIGCHALSRDGTKMVAEAGGQNDGRLLLLDVGTKQPKVPFGAPPKSVFEAWNPDGSQFVGVYGDNGATNYNLLLFDGNTGASAGSIDVGANKDHATSHPDWSPDGQHIAYVRMGVKGTNQRFFNGAIEMVTESGGAWSQPKVIVPSGSGKNHYYPAFSPDGGFIAFNRSICQSGNTGGECDADTDPTATLLIVAAAEGATPIEMIRANAPGIADGNKTALTNSYPKWSPFIFRRTDELGTRLEWITFSSTRKYGLRSAPGDGTLLWMAAVDPDRAGAEIDPSWPAFALPFQDLDTSNHIAQWTEKTVVVE